MAVFPRKTADFRPGFPSETPISAPFSLGNGPIFPRRMPARTIVPGRCSRRFGAAAILKSCSRSPRLPARWPQHGCRPCLSSALPAVAPRSPRFRSSPWPPSPPGAAAPPCAPDNGGLSLADGFCAASSRATSTACGISPSRPDGDLYAATGGGFLRGGVAAFRDRDGDGKMDERASFGPRGGNDVAVHDGYLYLALDGPRRPLAAHAGPARAQGRSRDDRRPGSRRAATRGQDAGLPGRRRDAGEDRLGHQQLPAPNRTAKSPGRDPVHRARAPRRHLAVRCRPGRPALRGWPPLGHGHCGTPRRSACSRARARSGPRFTGATSWAHNWGFSDEANANNPGRGAGAGVGGRRHRLAVLLLQQRRERKVLAPEYGGDGRTVGRCATAKAPAIAFPGHWAPMALQFYPGDRLRRGVQGRAVPRVPRQLEPRAAAAGGLPRGVRAVRGRKAHRHVSRPSPRVHRRAGSGRWGWRSGRTGRCSCRLTTDRHDLADREALMRAARREASTRRQHPLDLRQRRRRSRSAGWPPAAAAPSRGGT